MCLALIVGGSINFYGRVKRRSRTMAAMLLFLIASVVAVGVPYLAATLPYINFH